MTFLSCTWEITVPTETSRTANTIIARSTSKGAGVPHRSPWQLGSAGSNAEPTRNMNRKRKANQVVKNTETHRGILNLPITHVCPFRSCTSPTKLRRKELRIRRLPRPRMANRLSRTDPMSGLEPMDIFSRGMVWSMDERIRSKTSSAGAWLTRYTFRGQ